ncbi:hypothetical protein OS493_013067 [Desmophyllum pertusum]|uniref:Uncharacterized protein n=1 Tax=Desmophyllum pertusum TaxID=174260 RepID=A0A9W9YSS3_9CNID|nr:hypothetical protein OS493_013067 [Desmophyllum pertusum]
MTDRSVLSDELATFCAKYPIYYVKRMKESLISTRIQTGETKIRKRRQPARNDQRIENPREFQRESRIENSREFPRESRIENSREFPRQSRIENSREFPRESRIENRELQRIPEITENRELQRAPERTENSRELQILLSNIQVSLAVLRRQTSSYVEIESDVLCSGGKGIITTEDVGDCLYVKKKFWNAQCRITSRTCYWMVVCSTFKKCYDNHLRDTVFLLRVHL